MCFQTPRASTSAAAVAHTPDHLGDMTLSHLGTFSIDPLLHFWLEIKKIYIHFLFYYLSMNLWTMSHFSKTDVFIKAITQKLIW